MSTETTETLEKTPMTSSTPSTPSTSSGTEGSGTDASTGSATGEAKKGLEPLTDELIMKALEGVIDPELHMNIVELGLVYNVTLLYAADKARIAAAKAEEAKKASGETSTEDAKTEDAAASDESKANAGSPVADASTSSATEATSEDIPDVEVEMTLTSPGCPYGPMIMGQVPTILKGEFKDEIGEVDVHLTFAPPWDPATMASEDVKFELGIF